MKNRLILLFLYYIFIASSIIAQKTVVSAKTNFCFTESVEVRTEFIDIANYSLKWQFKTISLDWNDIQNLPCIQSINGNLLTLTNFLAPDSFDIRCVYKNNNTSIDSISNSVKIKILPGLQAPQISSISQAICYNTAPPILSVTVPATGSDGVFTYQWQQSTNNTTFIDITGETSQTFQAGSITQATYYRVVATSSSGCGFVASASSKVDVYSELLPGKILGSQDICYNSTTTLLSQWNLPTGGGGNYAYQWQVSTDDINYDNIIGEKTNKYQPGNLTSSLYYRLQVTSVAECGIAYTPSIKITVLPDITAPQITNITQPICYDTAPTLLSVTKLALGGDDIFFYQWQQSIDNISFSNISGEILKYYQPPVLTQTTYYRVVATSNKGCGSVTSASSKVEVYSPLTVDNLTNQTICYNTQPTILTAVPHGGGDSYIYQWQESTNGTNFTDILTATGITYQPILLTLDRYYRVLVVSQKGCSSAYSNSMKVTVYGELKSGSIGNAQTICYNTVPALLQQATLPTGGNGTYSYQWQVSTDNITFTNISGQTTVQYQTSSLTSSRFYRLQVTTGSGCGIVFTPSIKITVLPDKVAPQISTNSQPICYNTAPSLLSITIQATGSDGNFTYQWQQSTNNLNFTDIQGETALTYQATALTQTTYYRVVATATYGCGSIASASSKVEVYAPLTVDNLINQTICYNTQPTSLTAVPHGGGDSYIYLWQESTNGTNFTDIQTATGITYQPILLTMDRYYRVLVVSQKGCSSAYSNSMKVTVYGELKSGSITGEQEVCYKEDAQQISMNIDPTGSNEIYSFQWQLSTNNTNWADIAGETTKNYAPKHMLTTSYFRLKVNSLCGTVYTNSLRTLVNPLPAPVSISGDTCVCSNQYSDYSINGVLNPLYKLEWSITGGEFLNANNIDVKNVSVKWDKTSQINKLSTTQTVILTGCKLIQDFVIKKLTLQSPERKEIIRKSTTNILISTEKDLGIHYQWGFTSISDNKTALIDDSDRRFVQYPTIINTDNYIYWVKTSIILNKDTCSATSTYQATKKQIKELESSNYSIYPNPVRNFLNIVNNSDKNTKYTIKIASLTGRILYENIVDESIKVDKTVILDLPRGIYVLEIIDVDSKTTQKLIIN